MGSLVPLAVRIDVSRLIDRSQPFRAAWPPRLAPEPPDFHPSQGVDNNPGRLQRRGGPAIAGFQPSADGLNGSTGFQLRNAARLAGIPCSRGKEPLFEEFQQPSVAPMRFAGLYWSLASADFKRKASFFRLDATGNSAAKRRPRADEFTPHTCLRRSRRAVERRRRTCRTAATAGKPGCS